MPNYQRLTDRTFATGVSENDIIHIVITGDTSQNPAGSSYKATIKQVSAAVSFDRYVTGFTYSPNTFTIADNSGVTYNATINTVTGLTVNGTLSATTYQNLPTDVFVTGGTYNSGTSTISFTNNTGGTFSVTGITGGSSVSGDYLPLSGGTVTGETIFTSGLTANTISATTYQNLPIDPDTYVTGFTYTPNTFTIADNSGNTFDATIDIVTGLTVNGNLSVTGNTNVNNLSATTISATTYQNLPLSQREILLASNSGYWSQTENDEDIYVAANFCGWNGCPWNVINEEFPTRLRSNIGVPVPIDILSSGTLKLCGTVSGINEDSENSLTIKLYKYKCSELTGSTFTTTEIASGSTSFTTEGVTCFTLTVSEELLECDTNIVVGFNSDATGGGNRYFTYTLVYNEGIDPL